MNTELEFESRLVDKRDRRYWEELSACPLCKQAKLDLVTLAKDRHYGNSGEFPVVKCSECGLWFLNPMPSLQYLSGAYPTDYYSYTAQTFTTVRAIAIRRAKILIRKLMGFDWGTTGDPAFRRPGTMLDIGCGAGTFLLNMRDKGWQVYGVELSPDAAERGRQLGLDIFGGTLEAARYPDRMFDYVRSNHSFEHIHNPREVLREVKRILKPNGRLFIGVPNVNGLMSRIYGTYWWYLGAPVHTFGYCPETLEKLLVQEGFRVTKLQYNSTFGGVFGSLQIYLNRKNGKGSEEGWVYCSKLMRLLGHWIARVTDLFRVGDCIEVIAQPEEQSSPEGVYR